MGQTKAFYKFPLLAFVAALLALASRGAPAVMKIQPGASNSLSISWTGPGTLQEAPAITGLWANAVTQNNPQTDIASNREEFFRIAQPTPSADPVYSVQDDIAFWSAGVWEMGSLNNSNAFQWTTNFNLGTSYAVIGDYNGDGFIDLGEVQENSPYLYWYWNLNNGAGGWNRANSYTIFGLSGSDLPCAADFNGDGRTDLAVFRGGTWYIGYAPCTTNGFAAINNSGNFGAEGDLPVPGDFNGDGFADLAVFRPGNASWYVSFSTTNGPNFVGPYAINGLKFGEPGDIPAVGAGTDGYAEMILYRPSTHQVLVNLHNPNKPTFQGYGDANGYGNADLIYTYSNISPTCVAFADVADSRPQTASMPSPAGLNLAMPGWSCLFDNSLNVPQWDEAWSDIGINEVQFFSWMRAHEEINPLGPNWNTWVGDEQLWTSKSVMNEKIAGLQVMGAKAMCYAALYAATPAFASEHPAWEMLDPTTLAPLDYPPGSGYLYLMCINTNASYPYVINGSTYTNFSQYLLSQTVAAQKQFNWDGWKWDWYGIPSNYVCTALSGEGNLPLELGGFVNALNFAIKQVRSNCVMTAEELPNSYSDTPLNDTAVAVDQQFLEIWPDGTGPNYSDIYAVVDQAATAYGDKPVSANFYPQTTNFSGGWTRTNIDYQFATCLAAGGYPGAQIVDGTASFVTTTPMTAVRYPDSVLARIALWNNFVKAYGGYYYFSSPTYLIHDPLLCAFSISNAPPGIVCDAKERRDKRTFKTDTVIASLINYGSAGDLSWDEVNAEPSSASATLNVTAPANVSFSAAYLISPELATTNPTMLAMTHTGSTYSVTIPSFHLFATVVFTTQYCTNLPPPPAAASTSFPNYPIQYDFSGATLNGASNGWSVLDGIASPLELANNFNGTVSSWSFSTNAYYSKNMDAQSIEVTPSQLLFTTTSEHAIRCALTNFSTFQLAVKADVLTTNSWFGFRLYNAASGTVENYYYKIGGIQTNLAYAQLSATTSTQWQYFTRNLSNDIAQSSYFGPGWSNAVVTGVILGPVAGGNAYYDAFRFVHN